MGEPRDFREKVLDVAVYAPVGVLRRLRDDLPALIETGRREVTDRVRVARWIGEMAVTYGRAELQRRLAESSTPPAIEVTESASRTAPPFAGYDELPAEQLVQLLAKFPVAELAMIRVYEQQQRRRRTVLAKIDQLIDA